MKLFSHKPKGQGLRLLRIVIRHPPSWINNKNVNNNNMVSVEYINRMLKHSKTIPYSWCIPKASLECYHDIKHFSARTTQHM
jgi:hypothetical protein